MIGVPQLVENQNKISVISSANHPLQLTQTEFNVFSMISAFIFTCRGIGAVVYNVPELENDQRLKISLRSVENEDTTPISQVVPLSNCAYCIFNVTLVSYTCT